MTEIVVYNTYGQAVKTLVKQYRPSGNYLVVWDCKDSSDQRVPIGSYFYEVKVGDDVVRRKMMLIK